MVIYRDPEMISITASPEAPSPRIRILDAHQREVETVRIGDRLTFRIEIPEDSKILFFFQWYNTSSNTTLPVYVLTSLKDKQKRKVV